MNYLGHLFLTRHRQELMSGVFLGDHIKGTLKGEHPRNIETGIRFHRAVDVFVDAHPMQHRSTQRLPDNLRRYGGIICDVVYDYYLAKHWRQFTEEELDSFCSTAYSQILDAKKQLPERALETVVRMQHNSSLEKYGTKQYIERSLIYIGQRLKRENPLHLAFAQFEKFEAEFEQDFMSFLPEVDEFGQRWLQAL